MDVATTLRQVFSVLLVFVLLGWALWKFRRPVGPMGSLWRKPAGGVRALETVGRLTLTPQHALHLVRVHGREIVVATHPQGCTLMSEKSVMSEKISGACA
jgi:flagellar biogenesis protein FliO